MLVTDIANIVIDFAALLDQVICDRVAERGVADPMCGIGVDRQIAARLNAAGVKSRRGKWGDTSIRRLVNEHVRTRKARYLGGSQQITAP